MPSSDRTRIAIVAIATVLACAAFFLSGAFRVDAPDYARFAGDAHWNTANVLSNLGFLIVGVLGLAMMRRAHLGDDDIAAIVFFAGVTLTAFGSAWFHLRPLENGATNVDTLFVDRLPMTIAFAGLIALALRDRVFSRPYPSVLPLLVVIGLATVVWWYRTADLFPYAFFQAWTAAGMLLLLVAFRPRHSHSHYLVVALLLFGLAKACEAFNARIYALTAQTIAGHPLKHIAGALAVWMVLLWLRKRAPLMPPAPPHRPR
jgi:hypothetical protein